MSFYDNYQFFCVLIFILMPAMLLGILEQPLKWYSTAATFLFTALAFLSKPQQAALRFGFFCGFPLLSKAAASGLAGSLFCNRAVFG